MTILATGNPSGMVIDNFLDNMGGPGKDPRQEMIIVDKADMLTPSIVSNDETVLDRFHIPFTQTLTVADTFWVHFRWSNPSEFATQTAQFKLLGLRNFYFRLRGHGRFGYVNNVGDSEISSAISKVGTGYKDVDCFFDVPNGRVDIYVNGALMGSRNVTFGSDDTFTGISYATTQSSGRMGELCVSTVDTRGYRIQQAKVAGPGAVSQWSGDHQSVSSDQIDARQMSTTGVNSAQTFAIEPLDPLVANMIPEALVFSHSTFALADAEHPFIRHVISDGTSIADDDSLLVLGNHSAGHQLVMEVNPFTAEAWKASTIEQMQVGIRNIGATFKVTNGTDAGEFGFSAGVYGTMEGTWADGSDIGYFRTVPGVAFELGNVVAGTKWADATALLVTLVTEDNQAYEVFLEFTGDKYETVTDVTEVFNIFNAATAPVKVFVLAS